MIPFAFRYGNLEMSNLSAVAIALTGVVSIVLFLALANWLCGRLESRKPSEKDIIKDISTAIYWMGGVKKGARKDNGLDIVSA